MSQLINRLNKSNHENNSEEDIGEDIENIEENVEDVDEDVDEEEDEEEDIKNDNEQVEESENIVYIIKVNGDSKCYCSTSDEVNSFIDYIISQLKYKLHSQGWNNIQCITRDDKILWKVIDSNRIIAQITGNRPNSLIFYEHILAEIEVEIVKRHKQKESLKL